MLPEKTASAGALRASRDWGILSEVLHANEVEAADAHCELVVARGCVHVYALMPIPEARRAADTIATFLGGGNRGGAAHVPAVAAGERR